MTLEDYTKSREMLDQTFTAIIFAALFRSGSYEVERIKVAFPNIYEEFRQRYWCPGGVLPSEGGTSDLDPLPDKEEQK